MIDNVHVPLDGRAYDIFIGPGLIGSVASYLEPLLSRPKVAIITDSNIAPLHLARLESSMSDAGIEYASLILPAGETTKNWQHLQQSVEWLLDQKIERRDVVIAFGGGVIGDLVGFAAAILRRGVRFVQMPTTLLAQVDSSVGGKTAINTLHGKNLVGAFHQPSLVLSDVDMLGTLTPRDYLAGYGEVMKYGLLGDEDFFTWLEGNAKTAFQGDVEKRMHAIKRSCQMKSDIVVEDETELGNRALLNLGHTFCHAFEAATAYDSERLLHGEGVAIGCSLAFETSARLGLCSQETPSRVRAHLADMGMKTSLKDIPGELPDASALVDLMGQDKKVVEGALTFIMARSIGDAFFTRDVPRDLVVDVLKEDLS